MRTSAKSSHGLRNELQASALMLVGFAFLSAICFLCFDSGAGIQSNGVVVTDLVNRIYFLSISYVFYNLLTFHLFEYKRTTNALLKRVTSINVATFEGVPSGNLLSQWLVAIHN